MSRPPMPWRYPAGWISGIIIVSGPEIQKQQATPEGYGPASVIAFVIISTLLGYALAWIHWRVKRPH